MVQAQKIELNYVQETHMDDTYPVRTRWGYSPVNYEDYIMLKKIHKHIWASWRAYCQNAHANGYIEKAAIDTSYETMFRQYYSEPSKPSSFATFTGKDSTGTWWEASTVRYPSTTNPADPFHCISFHPLAVELVYAYRVARKNYPNPEAVEYPTIERKVWRKLYKQLFPVS